MILYSGLMMAIVQPKPVTSIIDRCLLTAIDFILFYLYVLQLHYV